MSEVVDILSTIENAIKEEIEASKKNLKYHQEHTKNNNLIAEWRGAIQGEQFCLARVKKVISNHGKEK